MEFLHARILWQILLSAAGVVCLATAVSWFRVTYKMYKAREAHPLLLPFPIFVVTDIYTVLMRRLNQNRLPSNLELGLEKIRFESTITNNYLKAFMLLTFSFTAGWMAFQMGG
jgi:hypothetical protein